jgi:hypothetical protein
MTYINATQERLVFDTPKCWYFRKGLMVSVLSAIADNIPVLLAVPTIKGRKTKGARAPDVLLKNYILA